MIRLVAFLALPAALRAGELAVTATDRDLGIPLEGVLVTLTGEESSAYTNADGRVVLTVPEGSLRTVLHARMPGYDEVRRPVDADATEISIEMTLSGLIEGEELVVEGKAPAPDESEAGVSVAMDREIMETTANIGMVEDVMSSIKTLPGVGYTGNWDAQPSIRGGYPDELAATLDGFYVTYPFQWGGGYSIFNPNMVESAKLSHGIYSARYGRAMSGLLEVETVTPDEPRLRIDSALSTTSTDLFAQVPTGDSSGLLIGGKITYLESMKLLFSNSMESVKKPPYIRNIYGKWMWNPSSDVSIYVNGFFGSDGVGFGDSFTEDSVSTTVAFDYRYNNAFVSGGMSWAMSDRWRLDLSGGYNINVMEMEYEVRNSGSVEYSDAYIAAYDGVAPYDSDGVNGLINGSASFSVDNLDEGGVSETALHQGQFKAAFERILGDSSVVSFGTEAVLHTTRDTSEFYGWTDYWDGGDFSLIHYAFDHSVDGNKNLNTALFLLWEFGLDRSSRWSGEIGIRGDHYYQWNDEFDAVSMPVILPRLSTTWHALEDRGALESLNVSFGSGIFSSLPMEADLSTEDLKLETRDFIPDRMLSNVVGLETRWNRGWKISAEGYYKYYINRLVVTGDDGGTGGDPDLFVSTDGRGYAAGFDVMVQKSLGRKLDGYLTYSFIYPRFRNPAITGTQWETDMLEGEPLDRWYYPYYHRLHNVNLILNYRPWERWTFTLKGSFATGAPREDVGSIISYPAEYPYSSGTYIERYSRTAVYSDSLRNGISIPVDIRIAYGTYLRGKKIRLETYIGIQDIFVNLYKPKANSDLNPITGEENRDTSADFSLGLPIISFGFKAEY